MIAKETYWERTANAQTGDGCPVVASSLQKPANRRCLVDIRNRCGKPPLFDGHLKSLQWVVVVNWRAAIKFRLHASQPRAEHRTAGRKSARRCYVCKVALSLQKESGPDTQGIGFGAAIRVCLKGEKGPDSLRQSISGPSDRPASAHPKCGLCSQVYE